jgi:hypothetical protein
MPKGDLLENQGLARDCTYEIPGALEIGRRKTQRAQIDLSSKGWHRTSSKAGISSQKWRIKKAGGCTVLPLSPSKL